MKRLSEDPFTDGSYAREWSPRMVWDAVHGETPTQEHREILDWWKDKPHQVLYEACEGWRQSEVALAERERECERLKRESAEAFCAWIERLRVEGQQRGSPFVFETSSDALREFRAVLAAADRREP